MDKAFELADHPVERCIIFQREQCRGIMSVGRDLDWCNQMADTLPVDCVPIRANDPLYILYTSATSATS
ncbi:MAG: propionyl-CoA synthetase, partial [Porticoccaceae bacterium]|nr:propionyl-CoA synthetase [Porticoccaceae bacterium]